MLKLLFIGVFSNPHSTNVSQLKYFRKLGVEVIEYDYRLRDSLIGSQKRDQEIVKVCKGFRPDIILFSKCNGVAHWVVGECAKLSRVILWYMDPLHNFDSELIDKIKLSHVVACGLSLPYKEALKYNKNSYFVHEGFDPEIFYPTSQYPQYDVSFIGSLYGERSLYHQMVQFKVFNNKFGNDHNLIVNSSKINLNFASSGCSDRVYKILAAKGFLLTNRWPNMDEDFADKKDLVVFEGVQDLKDKIKFYLKHPQLRKHIAEKGYKTVQKYTVSNWAKKILEIAQ